MGGDEEGTEQQEEEGDRHPPNVTFLQLLTLQPRRCAPCVYLTPVAVHIAQLEHLTAIA